MYLIKYQVVKDSSESEEDDYDEEEGEGDINNVQTEVVKPLKSDNKWLAAEQDDSEDEEVEGFF